MVRNLHYIIEEKDRGKRIDAYLKEKDYSRAVLIELKKTKTGIMKNGEWACVNETLEAGDTLAISLIEEEASQNIVPVRCELDILYEDEDILVVNKPYNMPIHPSINNYDNTLANGVIYYYKEQNRPCVFRCINRLDRDTTGVTIIAKHLLSAAILAKQVSEGQLKRSYLAFVEGVTEEASTIHLPIGRAEGSIIKRAVDGVDAKEAITHYRRLEVINVDEQQVSIIALRLETGRTHQIRVHMSHIGHPLLGDFLYNESKGILTRQALHSVQISFEHPITGESMMMRAPLALDMRKLVEVNHKNAYDLYQQLQKVNMFVEVSNS